MFFYTARSPLVAMKLVIYLKPKFYIFFFLRNFVFKQICKENLCLREEDI